MQRSDRQDGASRSHPGTDRPPVTGDPSRPVPPVPGVDSAAFPSPETLVDLLPDAAVVLDADLRVRALNAPAAEMFDRASEAVVGEPFDVLLPRRQRTALLARTRDFLAASETVRQTRGHPDFAGRRRDGEEFPIEASIAKLPAAVGGRLLVVLRDMSRQYRRERQLVQAQTLAHVGSWEWSLDSDRVEWSEELYRIYGLDPAETPDLALETFLDRVHPEDRDTIRAHIEHALETLEPFDFEERIVRPDGEMRRLRSRGEVIADEDGRPIRLIGVCHDVTEQREAEAGRREAEAMAEAREEALAVVAHDLRQPLNQMMGGIHLLETRTEDEVRAEAIEKMHRAVSHMNRLIDHLLDAARIEAGTFGISRSEVKVRSLVEDAVDGCRAEAREAGVDVAVTIDPVPETVEADRERLVQVLGNLLSNAIRHSEAGSRVDLGVASREEAVCFVVRDRGPGIPPEERERLFQRYWQSRHEAHDGGGTAGLGLSIAKGIVDAHGGRIWAESEVGRGSEFWFTVPTE